MSGTVSCVRVRGRAGDFDSSHVQDVGVPQPGALLMFHLLIGRIAIELKVTDVLMSDS